MGGVGSGGRRPGAGRPRKTDEARALGGNAGRRGRVLAHPSSPVDQPLEVEEFDAPNDLTFDERRVWMELAPHAFKQGTLIPAYATAFTALCRVVLLERQLAQSVLDRGSSKHMSAFQQMNKGLDAFRLRADGRPVAAARPASAGNAAAAFRKAKVQA